MMTMTADATLQAALGPVKGLTEIRAPEGHLLGYLLPALPRDELFLYLKALAAYDPAEMQRRKEPGQPGRTTQEVLAHLATLETPACATR